MKYKKSERNDFLPGAQEMKTKIVPLKETIRLRIITPEKEFIDFDVITPIYLSSLEKDIPKTLIVEEVNKYDKKNGLDKIYVKKEAVKGFIEKTKKIIDSNIFHQIDSEDKAIHNRIRDLIDAKQKEYFNILENKEVRK